MQTRLFINKVCLLFIPAHAECQLSSRPGSLESVSFLCTEGYTLERWDFSNPHTLQDVQKLASDLNVAFGIDRNVKFSHLKAALISVPEN